jgi:hypothetical protein
VPYTIRHTLATWLSEKDVPDGQITAWFGHGKESTTRHWYVKRRVYRPDYLAAAAAAVEELMIAVKSEAGEVGASPASSHQPGCVRVSSVAATKRREPRTP